MIAALSLLTLNLLLHNAAADADPWSSLRQLNVPFLHTSNFTQHLQKTPVAHYQLYTFSFCNLFRKRREKKRKKKESSFL
jgi:hypothetical protein